MRDHKRKAPVDERLLGYARSMRTEATDAENRLWQKLRDRQLGGFKFRRQVVLAGYVVDFYCAEAKLAVELDGSQHMEAEEAKYDEGRTAALGKLGVRIVRFWDNEVFQNMDGVLSAIYQAVRPENLRPPSP